MYKKEKATIIKDQTKPLRCIKKIPQRSSLYSWKNYVRPEINDRFQNLSKKQSTQHIPIYSRYKCNESFFSEAPPKLTKQMGTSTRAIQNYFSQDQDHALAKTNNKIQSLTSASSSQLHQHIISQIINKSESDSQRLDLYHLGLKEEERLYLLQKFMEHYQKIHGFKV